MSRTRQAPVILIRTLLLLALLVTAHTERNRASVLCIEGTDSTGHANKEQTPGITVVNLNITYQLVGEQLCRKNEKATEKIRRNLS